MPLNYKQKRRRMLDAIRMDNADKLRRWLRRGVDINARKDRERTPLHIAIEAGNDECLRLLIERGADINSSDWFGSPLMTAAACNNLIALSELLNAGVDVNTVSDAGTTKGMTALHVAAFRGMTEAVGLLLDCGAEINAVVKTADVPNWTALTYACYWKRPEVVRLLLSRQAQVNLTDAENRSVTEIARLFNGFVPAHGGEERDKREAMLVEEIVEMLKAAGAKE